MPTTNPLQGHLLSAASQAARAAVDLLPGIHQTGVASLFLNAGMAAEFLLRAVVAEISPALLFVTKSPSEKRTAVVMLRAHRDVTVDRDFLLEQRSADLSFIKALAVEAVPLLRHYSEDLDDIVNRRNAVAHMFLADGSARRSTLTGLARVVDAVLTHLNAASTQGFWGPERHGLITSLLAEESDATLADVELAMHTARRHLEGIRTGLSSAEQERVIAVLEAQGSSFYPPGPTEVFRDTCPACGRQAELIVRLADDTSDLSALELVDRDDEGVPGAVLIPQEPQAVQLQCPVCRLRLSYAELQAVFPPLADLDAYEIQPRCGTMSEYNDLIVLSEPY